MTEPFETEKKLKRTAEKLLETELNQQNNKHVFSDNYHSKKNQFLNQLPDSKRKFNFNKVLMIAIVIIFFIPTTIYAGTKIYQWIINKNHYELNLSVKGQEKYKHEKFYKLNFGYIPKNLIQGEDSTKFGYKDNKNDGGISFSLWQLSGKAEFNELYTKDYKEITFGNHQSVLIKKQRVEENLPNSFDTIVYLFFEKEGYVLQAYISNDMPKTDWEKMLNHVSLKETTKKESTPYQKASNGLLKKENIENKTKKYLPEKDENIHQVGEPVIVNVLDNQKVAMTVNNIKILDNISQFNETNFSSYMFDELKEKGLISEDGKLLSFEQHLIQKGDGSQSVDSIKDKRKTNIKFVYLTATIENLDKKVIKDLYFQNGLYLLNKEKKGLTIFSEEVNFTAHSGEVDYLDSHGEGKSFYDMPDFSPNEIREIHFGYFVDDNQLNKLFLPVFYYQDPAELKEKGLKWIDLRQ